MHLFSGHAALCQRAIWGIRNSGIGLKALSCVLPKRSNVVRCFTTSQRKDPYKILGVNRNASKQEIKKKYLELIKRYHPDRNPSKAATERLNEIISAYESLSNSAKPETDHGFSRNADKAGEKSGNGGSKVNFTGFESFDDDLFLNFDFSELFSDQFARQFNKLRPGDMQASLTLSFLEAVQGCQRRVKLPVKAVCTRCDNFANMDFGLGLESQNCTKCKGFGTISLFGNFKVTCGWCNGSGMKKASYCRECKGTGVVNEMKSVDVRIPAGVHDLSEICFKAMGNAIPGSAKNGDLFLKIKVLSHPSFKRNQNDIHVDVPVTLKQYLLGGTVKIPTLEGELNYFLSRPIYPEERLTIRNKGVREGISNRVGDLVVHWVLSLPESLSPEEEKLIVELDKMLEKRHKDQESRRKA